MKDIYKNVSYIYNDLMIKVDYRFWAKYLHRITSLYFNNKVDAFELAAGNCRLGKYFSKYFKNYFVSDISKSMLSQSDNFKGKIFCCDLLNIPVKINFDCIICTFDSINYLLSKKKVSVFFREVNRILDAKGIFIFDAALEMNSIKHQKVAATKGTVKNINYLRKSVYLPKSRYHKNIFSITFPDKTTKKEIHKQKIYTLTDYFELLEKNDLYAVECFRAFTFKDARPTDLRAQFVVKRKF